VPESERERRHRLRAELTRLGLGTVAPGVWVAPGHLADEVGEVLARHGLAGYVDLFRRAQVPVEEARDHVARWWDLDALHARYAEFIDRHDAPGGADVDPAGAFGRYVRLLTDWRALPYADPGLPLDLLPADWNGARAADLFAGLRERLAGPAHAHAATLIGG
jgi:phenylacetic acid degradation operon negative regulatory protein